MRTLRNLGVEAIRVVAVYPEAILFLSGAGSPWTAWIHRQDGKLKHHTEAGFPAFPKEG